MGGAPGTEAYSHRSRYNAITVDDVGYLRVLKFGVTRQSSMYLDDPYETDFEYPGYLHVTLAVRPEAKRTLVIGLGGATVVKRMWRDYPGMRLDVVELDPAVVIVARRFFELPDDPRIRVVTDDGRHFVETADRTWDIAIVDAFDDDVVPPRLTTREFMSALRAKLEPGGVVAYNFIGSVAGEHSAPFRRLYRTMREVWAHSWLFVVHEGVDTEGVNLIALASDAALTVEELRDRIASRVDGRVTVPAFHLFANELWLERVDTAGVETNVDEPADLSSRGA